jgi:signal peptidase II
MPYVALAGAALGSMLCLDQGSKAVLLKRVAAGSEIGLPGGVRVRRVVNVRWTLGRRANASGVLVLWLLLCAAALLLLGLSGPGRSTTAVALGVALGGATGNLLDWLLRGGIVDFVDLRFWPVFNAADVGIVAGVALLVLAQVV